MASHCKPIKYSPKRGDKKDQKKGNKLKGFFPKLNFASVSKISPILVEKTTFLSMISKCVPKDSNHISTPKRVEVAKIPLITAASEWRQAESGHTYGSKTVPAQIAEVMSFSLFSLDF